MTELQDAKAKALWNKADAADKHFEEERSLLYRDGKKLYSDEEHGEQEAALRAERKRTARDVEQEVEQAMAETRQELENLQNQDPSQLLNATELESANSRRALINDDVAALSEGELVSRLKSVLASGDRASQFLFWQAARRKKAEIVERRGEQPYELNQALASLQTGLRGLSHNGRVTAGELRLDELRQAQTLAWSLQRGGRSVSAVYAKQAYGPTLDQLRQSGRVRTG
jgi:hypothetical protein